MQVSPEFGVRGPGGEVDGWIDFWIPVKRWGIELLRNGDSLIEHMRRFELGGAYYPLLASGQPVQYIVLNFTTIMPTISRPRKYPVLGSSTSKYQLNSIPGFRGKLISHRSHRKLPPCYGYRFITGYRCRVHSLGNRCRSLICCIRLFLAFGIAFGDCLFGQGGVER
jgi:hypothetical protein